MKLEEEMSPEAIRWLERRSEVIHDYVVPQIETMPDEIARVLFHKMGSAFNAETNAGRSGDQRDGGAGSILVAVEMFVHGWFKKLPREWQLISERLKRMDDPEYREYVRLKKKFERSK
jgi:hypothetical protein